MSYETTTPGRRRLNWMVAAALAGAGMSVTRPARAAPTQAPITGEILELTLDNPTDPWSGGTMVVGSARIILPRNLLIDFPANRMSLHDLFAQAPAGCAPQSGLAKADACRCGQAGAIATVLANRTNAGQVIAGLVNLAKGLNSVTGDVTFIDYTNGFIRVGGTTGSATDGVMVRLNDPGARHSLQSGPGCGGGPNCSADVRFAEDPDNYTNTFVNGYPICIPSTATTAQRTQTANAQGAGDAFCPATNRTLTTTLAAAPMTVADSTRFAPILIGDNLTATGNVENINGVEFLSAWQTIVNGALLSRADPTQPDYPHVTEKINWDAPAWQAQRARLVVTGSTTLTPPAIDFFSIHRDPATNSPHEVPLGSTVGNASTIIGLGAPAGLTFRLKYDVDFAKPTLDPRLDPCVNLANAGFSCPAPGGRAGAFSVLAPVARELVLRSRHVVNPGVVARDLSGNVTRSGMYLTPVTLDFPAFVEINPALAFTPFSFEGVPWLADRRLSADGCGAGPCENTPQPLTPYPFSGLDPRVQAAVPATGRVLAFFPFAALNQVAFPQLDPAAIAVAPVIAAALVCGPPITAAPTLASLSPTHAQQGAFLVVTMTGTGFTSGGTCSFGAGILASCLVPSPTTALALLDIDPAAAVGPRTVTFTNPDGKVATLAAGFTVDAKVIAAPLASGLTPGHAPQGSAIGVSVFGANFTTGATCSFGAGVASPCVVSSPNVIAASVSVGAAAVPGARNVTVTNPDGQVATLAGAFTVDAAATATPPPAVASIAPVQGTQGAAATVVLTGSGYAPGATCSFGAGIVAACTVTTANSATAVLSIDPLAVPGTRDVTVTNPDLRTSTLPAAFTVVASVPPVQPPAPTATLTAGPNPIGPTGSSTLTWSTTNATAFTLSPGGPLGAASGTLPVTPGVTTTYTLTVTGPGGTAQASTTVLVVNPVNPAPVATFAASPVTIQVGGATVLSWSTINATTATLGPGIGPVGLTGTLSVSPATTTTYTLLADGPGGTASAVVTVAVTAAPPPPPVFADLLQGVGPMGAGWVAEDGTIVRDGNGAVAQGTVFNDEEANGAGALGDLHLTAVVVPPASGNVGVRLRSLSSAPRNAHYGVYLDNFGRLQLLRRVASVDTALKIVATAVDPKVPHTLGVAISGTTTVIITVTLDGVPLLAFQDTSAQRIATPGMVMLAGRQGARWKSISISSP